MTDLRITIRNTSDNGGTFLTPFWFGFHDGSFDLFNSGEAASAGLEALAEDGNSAGLGLELLAADADATGAVITGAAGPISTQETTSSIVTVDGASNGQVSFGAMVLPSNDAFVGTGNAVKLFSDSGHFLGEQTVTFSGANVYDAGTEVNTELDAAFINQAAPNTGVDENGVVRLHEGFNGSAGNPVGEGDQIILGGTNAFGEAIDPIAADFTLPGTQVAQVHINTVVTRSGSEGRDFIFGRKDDDLVDAGGGNDFIRTGKGWDEIKAGAGNDWVNAGGGSDIISGGAGNDFMRGGRGNDDFVFASGDDGHDVIRDFLRGDDRLVLSGFAGITDAQDVLDHAKDVRGGTYIAFDDATSVYLRGVEVEDIDLANIYVL